jgi:hypothetical protein
VALAAGHSAGVTAAGLALAVVTARTAGPRALAGTARAGDVVSAAGRDVWVSGKALVHWNGRRWRVAVGESFTALAPVDRDDVWAVGTVDYEEPLPHPRIVHWDGRSWKSVRNGLYADLYGVTAASDRDVWAVGATAGTSVRQLVAHWNGRRWVSRTLARADWLNDVSAAAPDDVWAVGNEDIVHWNGRRWKAKIVRRTELVGVAAISRRDVWAVGTRRRGGVVLHYACR